MPPVKSNAYDLRASALKGTHADVESYADLASWLTTEIELALSNRSDDEDIRYAWTLYEQGRTRGTSSPWPDAADLTSPFAAEYVDALHARAMQTIFQEPVWTVDGFGEAAKRAPFVEEFHQRTLEEERCQSFIDETLMRAWIEGVGILEVSEAVDLRRERTQMRAKLALHPENHAPILGEDNQPLLETDADGNPVESTTDGEPSAEIELDRVSPVRMGPDYDVVPFMDFLSLPSHAKSRRQIWGYAKRFYRRVPDLVARATLGIYDREQVEALGTVNERTTDDTAPKTSTVVEQSGPTAEKELWEVSFLADLDGKGERWWLATVSVTSRILLRLKWDDRITRFLRFIPFPIPGRIDRGYSLITNKLITVIEEDTAVRNMWADKAALAISAPVKRLQGALWDPYEQPFGPHSVIDVRNMNEVEQMELSDVPASFSAWRQSIRSDADRLAGQNDTSLGQQSGGDATLGEVRLKAGYVEVRIDLVVKRLKEPLEELGQVRHAIWKRVLRDRKDGMPVPHSMAMGLEARGIDMQGLSNDGRITAEMLDGQFWFKPRGSVESADLNARMGYFSQFMIALANMAKVNPMVASLMATMPFAKSMIEEAMRVYRWQDKQALLGAEAQGFMQQQAQQMQMQQNPQYQFLQQMLESAGGPQGMSAGEPPAPQAMGVM